GCTDILNLHCNHLTSSHALPHRYFQPLFVFTWSTHPPDLPSFPTRRSSDLSASPRPTCRPGSSTSSPGREASSATRSRGTPARTDRKSTRLNSSHQIISYAVFCLKKKKPIILSAITSLSTEPIACPTSAHDL